MKKGYVYTVLFMLVISAVFTFLLAGTNALVEPTIEKNVKFDLEKSLLDSVGLDYSGTAEEVTERFAQNLELVEAEDLTYYRQIDEQGKTIGYSVPFSGSGLWGTIHGYIGVSEDLAEMKGLVFTEQNETPGLGGRISEDWFREQFRGLRLDAATPVKYGLNGDKQIDAITGATQTSNAITKIINQVVNEVLSKVEVQ